MSTTNAYPRLMAASNEVRGQWRTHKSSKGLCWPSAARWAFLPCWSRPTTYFTPARRPLRCWPRSSGAGWRWPCCRWSSAACSKTAATTSSPPWSSSRHPELHNPLINALQLGRGNTPGFSQSLIEAIVKRRRPRPVDTEVGRRGRPPADQAGRPVRPGRRAARRRLRRGADAALHQRPGPRAAAAGRHRPVHATRSAGRAPSSRATTRVAEGKPLTVDGQGARACRPRRPGCTAAPKAALAGQRDDRRRRARPARSASPSSQVDGSFDYLHHRRRRPHRRLPRRGRPAAAGREAVASSTPTPPTPACRRARRRRRPTARSSASPGTTVRLELTATKPLREAELVDRRRRQASRRERSRSTALGDKYVAIVRPVDADGQGHGGRRRASAAGGADALPDQAEDTEGYDNIDPLWRSIAAAARPAARGRAARPRRPAERQGRHRVAAGRRWPRRLRPGAVRILYRVNSEEKVRELVRFEYATKTEEGSQRALRVELARRG